MNINKKTIFLGIATFSASLLLDAVTHPFLAYPIKTTTLPPQAELYLAKASSTHKIRLGDTLFGIAYKYGVTLEALLSVNPDLQDNPNLIMVGQEVNLPDSAQTPTTNRKPSPTTTTTRKPSTTTTAKKPSTTTVKKPSTTTTVKKPSTTTTAKKPSTTTTVKKPSTTTTVKKPSTTATRTRSQAFANLNLSSERRMGVNRVGAKRGGGDSCTKNPNEQLKALLPETNFGYTLLDHPTFFWYVPELTSQSIPIKYSIRPVNHKNGEESFEPIVYETTLENKGAGVMSFTLASNVPSLKEGQEYEWEVKIECTEDTWIFTRGRIQRQSTDNPELNAQLEKAAIDDYPAIYAKAGIWYDALSTLAALRQKQPSNNDLASDWAEILKMIGFTDIAKAPLLTSKAH